MSIGRNITKYRVAAGLTQKQLADKIGKNPSSVSYYESNRMIPRMYVIEKIAAVLGVTKEDIISDKALTAYEKELLDVARAISTDGQRQLLIYARGLAATYPQDTEVHTA